MPRPRFIPVHFFADALAVGAVACILALLVLWPRSYHLGGDERVYAAPAAQLHFCSRDGRIMVGVYWPNLGIGRGLAARSGMIDLVNDDSRFVVANLAGWGVAMPHAMLAVLIGVVPAWRRVVYGDRLERARRLSRGLCRHCGYDLRAAHERCPECGAAIGGVKLAKQPAELFDDRDAAADARAACARNHAEAAA
jgi:hypothetical protein